MHPVVLIHNGTDWRRASSVTSATVAAIFAIDRGGEVPRKFLWEFEGPYLWGGLPVIAKDENCRQAHGRDFMSHKFNEIISATNSAPVKSQVF